MKKNIKIGEKIIGDGYPAYLVAEIGINHNGDLGLAFDTIKAAKQSGADAVKFQVFKTEEFIPDKELKYTYKNNKGELVTISQYDMFKKYELTDEMLDAIIECCKKNEIDWHATPMSIEGVERLIRKDTTLLKNGSDCLGHVPLLRAMAKTQLPGVLSLGMGTLSDIEEAVDIYRAENNNELILLHCNSQYPCPVNEVNLKRIKTLRDTFDVLTGFSDHTDGIESAIGASVYGACWIEKHFTLNKSLEGPDHQFSSDPGEFKSLVNGIRNIELAIGNPILGLSENEMKARTSHRLSCAASREINSGERIKLEDISFYRPGTGLSPKYADKLVGKIVNKNINFGDFFSLDDFL